MQQEGWDKLHCCNYKCSGGEIGSPQKWMFRQIGVVNGNQPRVGKTPAFYLYCTRNKIIFLLFARCDGKEEEEKEKINFWHAFFLSDNLNVIIVVSLFS